MSASAEVPKQPEDPELRNIIDKLAQFVAKNGPDFEQMTKQKQKENPRFGFLFGGDHFHYYQYKVTAEQAILKQQKQQPAAGKSNQIQNLENQLAESEKNLKAQWDVLMQQQQTQIETAIQKAEQTKLQTMGAASNLNLVDFDHVLDALTASCTKEAISNGKQWIFSNCTSDGQKEIILLHLLQRVRDPGATPNGRLHILYLINDWAHHCMRKKSENVTKLLERYVRALYCHAHELTPDPGTQDKTEKLLALWETHKYFADYTFQEMRDPAGTVASLKAAAATEHATLVKECQQKIQSTYSQYQQQHQEFARHVQQQMSALQAAKQLVSNLQQASHPSPPSPHTLTPTPAAPAGTKPRRTRFDQVSKQPPVDALNPPPTSASIPLPNFPPSSGPSVANFPQPPSFSDTNIPPPVWSNPPGPPNFNNQGPPQFGMPPRGGPPMFGGRGGPWPPGPPPGQPPMRGPAPWQNPPPNVAAGGPPPMSSQGPRPLIPPPKEDPNLIPSVAYYDLPAGLMVPLVKLEDSEYEPLDPNQLRLPPPMPPSDRLLAAIENFYAPPSHDNPRDSEGWERLGLYEYYRQKSKATHGKKKEVAQPAKSRSRSRSRSQEREREKERSRSRSPRRRTRRSSSSSRSSSSESRSRSGSPSPRPRRSPSASPPRLTSAAVVDVRLSEGNKGHQLLTKMGWGGGGLGAEEQGRQEPVPAGEVRERGDQFKGVGAATDPFESFRRQKAGLYVQRIISAQKERQTVIDTTSVPDL